MLHLGEEQQLILQRLDLAVVCLHLTLEKLVSQIIQVIEIVAGKRRSADDGAPITTRTILQHTFHHRLQPIEEIIMLRLGKEQKLIQKRLPDGVIAHDRFVGQKNLAVLKECLKPVGPGHFILRPFNALNRHVALRILGQIFLGRGDGLLGVLGESRCDICDKRIRVV